MSPEEIGLLLQLTRENLGHSISDAASATKISSRFLMDMEKGEFRKLGERPYVIGFVKTYAKYLGLCEKNISEIIRRAYPEYEAPKLQIYKTPLSEQAVTSKIPNGVFRQGFEFLSYRLVRLLQGARRTVLTSPLGSIGCSIWNCSEWNGQAKRLLRRVWARFRANFL